MSLYRIWLFHLFTTKLIAGTFCWALELCSLCLHCDICFLRLLRLHMVNSRVLCSQASSTGWTADLGFELWSTPTLNRDINCIVCFHVAFSHGGWLWIKGPKKNSDFCHLSSICKLLFLSLNYKVPIKIKIWPFISLKKGVWRTWCWFWDTATRVTPKMTNTTKVSELCFISLYYWWRRNFDAWPPSEIYLESWWSTFDALLLKLLLVFAICCISWLLTNSSYLNWSDEATLWRAYNFLENYFLESNCPCLIGESVKWISRGASRNIQCSCEQCGWRNNVSAFHFGRQHLAQRSHEHRGGQDWNSQQPWQIEQMVWKELDSVQ